MVQKRGQATWWPVVLVTTVLNLAVCGFVWRHVHASGPPLSLPYSAFFQSPDPIQIITSDPDIALIQQYAGGNISLSDYANHRLAADTDSFPADVRRFADLILHDEKTSLATTRIVMGIAELAQAHSKHVTMTTARSIRMSDLRSNDDFILIGSPRSNPWSAVFADELDFRFSFDKALGQEIIRNVHPRPHEALQYIPTAMGGATGQSYAIIALVRNPDQYGQVLLLAGANGESTEAAANFAMDTTRISAALQTCGVSPASRLQHFELLLRVDTMAGSPSNTNVEACHVLSGAPMPS
jgi:hypothetical protein